MKKRKRRKIATTMHAGFAIREIRPNYFMVDGQRGGKRERKCFRDLAHAKTYCSILSTQIQNEGTSALVLSARQREDAAAAAKILDGKASLRDAARFWMQHHGTVEGMTVEKLAEAWLKALRAHGCRDTTMRAREYTMNRLCRDFGDRPAASITRADLVDWMDAQGFQGQTRDSYRRQISTLYSFGMSEDPPLVEVNPAAGIKKIRMDERLPTPLSVDAVRMIMTAAEEYAPIMVPTLAVQFFAGLRPVEAKGLDWKAVDFKGKLLRVTPETSKVRRSRIIEMNQTLIDWLLPYRKASGPVGIETQSQFSFYMHRKPIGEPPEKGEEDKRPIGLLSAAGVKWIQDGPRKTFASMHYAEHGDAAKLAAILGHTGGHDVLFRHYRGLATKTDARAYWKILPARKT